MRKALIALGAATLIVPMLGINVYAAAPKKEKASKGASASECQAAARASGKFNFATSQTAGRAAVQRCMKNGVGAI